MTLPRYIFVHSPGLSQVFWIIQRESLRLHHRPPNLSYINESAQKASFTLIPLSPNSATWHKMF